jgi:hypothetical protein
MAVRGAQLTYGARRVSRGRFRVGGYRAFQPEFMDGRPRSSVTILSQAVRTSGAPAGGAAPPNVRLTRSVDRLEGRARRPLASHASTSKSALSPARQRINSSCQRARPTPGTAPRARTYRRQPVVIQLQSSRSAAAPRAAGGGEGAPSPEMASPVPLAQVRELHLHLMR